MVTVRFVTVDPCTHATCSVCQEAEQALREAMTVLGEAVPGGPEGERWRALGFKEGMLTLEHLQADEVGTDLAHAPYLMLEELVLMRGDDWDADRAALLVAKALYPSGWT